MPDIAIKPALFIQIFHTGLMADGRPNVNPVQINDLDVGYEYQHRKVPVYVPPGGSIIIPASSRSMLSFQQGSIAKFAHDGVIRTRMFYQPERFTTVNRPAATDYPIGVCIWNTTENQPNWSDGTNWVSGLSPAGAASGDLYGFYPGPLVGGIEGIPIEGPPPHNGDSLLYNSATNAWNHAPITFGGGPPTGPAGGSLAGLYPTPSIAAGAISDIEVAVANKDGLAATASMRTLGTGALQACAGNDSRLSDARTPTSHAVTHKNGGGDEVATATAAANAIPKAGAGGTLSINWIPVGSTSTTVCVGNDPRLSDARTPTAHASTHAGGSDAITVNSTTATNQSNPTGLTVNSGNASVSISDSGHVHSLTDPGHSHTVGSTTASNATVRMGRVDSIHSINPDNRTMGTIDQSVASDTPDGQTAHIRTMNVVFTAGWAGGDITINGTDTLGNSISETYVKPVGGGTVNGTKPFHLVTNYVNSSPTAPSGVVATITNDSVLGVSHYPVAQFIKASYNGVMVTFTNTNLTYGTFDILEGHTGGHPLEVWYAIDVAVSQVSHTHTMNSNTTGASVASHTTGVTASDTGHSHAVTDPGHGHTQNSHGHTLSS